MNEMITREIIESFLKCKFKSYLKLLGVKGLKSDYEIFLENTRPYFNQKATQKIYDKSNKSMFVCNAILNHKILNDGAQWITKATLKYGPFYLSLDGIKTVSSRSNNLNIHYIPILFDQSEKILSYQRSLLAIYGYVLGKIQKRQPITGIIIHGQTLKTITIKLSSNILKTRNLLEEIKKIQKGWEPPLILNNTCSICEYRKRCLQLAKKEENLSLLSGMTEKQISKYNRRGIFTVNQLSYTYRARKKTSSKATSRHDFALQALAIRDKRVFITEAPNLENEKVRVYFDIEGCFGNSFIYLIGALICTPNSETQYSFWADNPDQQRAILEDFLNLLNQFEQCQIFHYGAYDTRFLKRMQKKTTLTELIDKTIKNSINVLSLIYGRIYFPVYSNSLKHIAKLLGFSWKTNKASGINSIVWREEWENNKDPAIKNRLITYNSDDCAALKAVTDFIYAIDVDKKPIVYKLTNLKDMKLSYIDEIRKIYSRPDWKYPDFKIQDFDYINRCSYFDYQREKIYVRTNKNIAKQQAKKLKHPKWIKPTKRKVIECLSCPFCGSNSIKKWRWGIKRRKCLDLKITKMCVRSVVEEYASYKYICGECEKEFFPEEYRKMFKYGHSLKSWAIYEYVAHRATFKGIEGTFRDLFGLPVCYQHINVIKRIMAEHYQQTVEGIRKRLVAGSILHADETQVKLQRVGKGYVWVFTNLEEVLYVYKPSRDGNFLSEMFDGFSGVLISDFYAAYDWKNCEQQKCLIHLIRDLNNALISHPFEGEYKKLVAEFGSMLRMIVSTVDKYGLKRRNLIKFQRNIDKFFSKLEYQCFSSEITKSTQGRLLRNKDKLFTFIKYDGVPWNNNNAEFAIKRFAHYREIANGHVTEAGIIDYLVLLSIYQTCKYKGINFLKFLLSCELDISNYREKRGKKQNRNHVEASLLEQGFFDKKLRSKLPRINDKYHKLVRPTLN